MGAEVNKKAIEAMRERSGMVSSDDSLVSLLYELMRDYVPPGTIEGIMASCKTDTETVFTNGWLANYAKDLANRLRK